MQDDLVQVVAELVVLEVVEQKTMVQLVEQKMEVKVQQPYIHQQKEEKK